MTSFRYSDYNFLYELQHYNVFKLCEYSLLKYLKHEQYNEIEHKEIWQKLSPFLQESKMKYSEDIKFLSDFITQFSPADNVYPENHPNHIQCYASQAIDIAGKIRKTGGDIIEIGANQAICSLALKLLGFNVLATDLHHDLSDKIEQVSYRMGCYIRENLLGLPNRATFALGTTNLENISPFIDGVDAIVARGCSSIFGIQPFSKDGRLAKYIKLARRELFKKFIHNYSYEIEFQNTYENLLYLLKNIKEGGLILIYESIFFRHLEKEERIRYFERLKARFSSHCTEFRYSYNENNYEDPGWQSANFNILIRK